MSDPRLRPEQLNAMRAMLVSVVDAEKRPARSPRLASRIGFGALAVGVVGAVVAVAVVAPGGRPDPDAPAASAVQASELLRDAATATSDPAVTDGQFLKIATNASYLALTTRDGREETTIGYLESRVRELYLPADSAAGAIARTTSGAPSVFFGDGAQEFAAREWSGQPVASAPSLVAATDATRPVEDLAAMPRDPAALLDYLERFRYQAGSSDENVFAHVVDLLRAGTVKSDLRSALYGALALMPAVVVTEENAALGDRVGTAVGLRGIPGDTRQEIVVDPATGEYLGTRLVTVNGVGEIPAGTALEATAVSTTVVNSVPR